MRRVIVVAGYALIAGSLSGQVPTAAEPYSLYVTSEAGDLVTRIDVNAEGWGKAREIPVGIHVTSPEGPHNVAVAPDGRVWYVSLAHGAPFGSVWAFATGADTLLGRVGVGMFPTTVGISPDGDWAFVPNSDFHGDRGRANTVSALYLPELVQIAEIPTCDMPHGSRYNHAGTAVYIACMMSDELVEIDASAMGIRRRVSLGSGSPAAHLEHRGPVLPGAASSTMPGQNPDCLTTYVSVSPDDRLLYLACNHSNELQVRDAGSLEIVRRLATGEGAYNVEPSPDGRWVLVTNKKANSVSVFATASWTEAARVPTSRTLPHGIAFSPEGRFAFVTSESVGSDPGAVDAIDLATLERVASIEIGGRPTGVAVWRHP